jgi:RNA polymerase sigma factor (sigma-70 family)
MSPSSAEPSAPRIPEIDPEQRRLAISGDLPALNALVRALEPGVYNMALRMLGQRDDALDATQDILVRVVTHLASFKGDAAFSTWVYRIARNQLLTAATRARESPEVSFESIDERLATGLTFYHPSMAPLSALDKAEARDIALSCTQGMLLALDREHRLAYVLDVIFGLTSVQAADVLEITPAAHRQRLSRAKARLHEFMQHTCGLVNEDAQCRCHRQLPAVRTQKGASESPSGSRVQLPTLDDATLAYDQLTDMFDAVAVMRAQPAFAAPDALTLAIRKALTVSGWLKGA